jgi:hypothetical protein
MLEKRSTSLFSVAVLAILLFSYAAFAQDEPAFPPVPVKMTVTAEAHHGKQVPDVQASDVVVMQGKQRYRVTSWQPVNSAQVGAQLFVLIDDSLSTTDIGTKLGEVRSFIESQPAFVQTGVAYMRNGTAIVAQNLTSDHAQAAKALRLPIGEPNASASPYFSLQDLLKHWPNGSASRQVLMITNGIDPYWDSNSLDDPYVNSAIDQAQRAGVVVSAIYASGAGHFGHTFWRTTLAQSLLSEVADATGGESYYLGNESPVTFTPYFKELTERLQHQYVLGFDAQPGRKPGLQRVKVSTDTPGIELVGQTSVYVASGI